MFYLAGVALVVVVASGIAALVAVIRLDPGWTAAAEASGKDSLPKSSTWVILLGILGALGFIGEPIGLLSSALWCAAALIAARSEATAAANGFGNRDRRRLLTTALWAQAVGALTLAVLMLGSSAGPALSGGRPEAAGDALYTSLVMAWGVQFLAIGACDAIAAIKLERLRALSSNGGGRTPNKGIQQNARS